MESRRGQFGVWSGPWWGGGSRFTADASSPLVQCEVRWGVLTSSILEAHEPAGFQGQPGVWGSGPRGCSQRKSALVCCDSDHSRQEVRSIAPTSKRKGADPRFTRTAAPPRAPTSGCHLRFTTKGFMNVHRAPPRASPRVSPRASCPITSRVLPSRVGRHISSDTCCLLHSPSRTAAPCTPSTCSIATASARVRRAAPSPSA